MEKVNKEDAALLQALDELYGITKLYQEENVFNMDETGLLYCLLPRYTLLLPGEDVSATRSKKKPKERVSFIVWSNATRTHKIPCSMITSANTPACTVGRKWPIPYYAKKNHRWTLETTQ